jgi:predicted nuclease with TOPRIM domain
MDKEQLDKLREEIRQEMKSKAEFTNTQKENTDLKAIVTEMKEKVTKLEGELNDSKEACSKLEKQNKELSTELDEIKVVEAITKKKSLVDKLIAEAKLPKEVVSELFVDDLMSLEEKKDGDKIITFEAQVKDRINERKKLTAKSGRVVDNGDSFDNTKESLDDEGNKKDPKQALESFTKKIKQR